MLAVDDSGVDTEDEDNEEDQKAKWQNNEFLRENFGDHLNSPVCIPLDRCSNTCVHLSAAQLEQHRNLMRQSITSKELLKYKSVCSSFNLRADRMLFAGCWSRSRDSSAREQTG